jgi:hypothetical protein
MLTKKDFDAAYKAVHQVTLETKLVYSDFFSEQCNNHVYLSRRICRERELTRYAVPIIRFRPYRQRIARRD